MEINGHTYTIGRMGVMNQLHVVRRILPIFTDVAEAAKAESTKSVLSKTNPEDQGDALLLEAAPLITETISRMPDADVDYVINACLDVCLRKDAAGNYVKLRVNGSLVFNDINLPEMLSLVTAVIKENLGSFFPSTEAAAPSVPAR